MEAFQASGLRTDGRRSHQVRKVACSFGVGEGFDGSALLSQGLTKVMVLINGPRQVGMKADAKHDRAIIKCQVAQANFSTTERRRRRVGDKRSTGIAAFVEETFGNVIQTKLYQNSQIDITIHILQAEGSVLAACINATSLALVHAGIPMIDFVTCCSIGYLDDTIVLDLNHQEESMNGPELSLTLMPKSSKILTLKMGSSSSRVNASLLDKFMEEAQVGCHQLNKILVALVREYVADMMKES